MSTPSVFSDADATSIFNFWFTDCDLESNSIPEEIIKRWFMRSSDFDNLCHDFKPVLDRVVEAHTPKTITTLATTPRRTLSLLILLDQIPRNLFRDEKSAVVYSTYDLYSQAVSRYALDRGMQRGEGDVWAKKPMLAVWFSLPLTHSEDIGDQERALALAKEMVVACRGEGEAVESAAEMGVKSMGEHLEVIRRFGRYPYRNKVLGRESTEEEKKWLEDPKVPWTR